MIINYSEEKTPKGFTLKIIQKKLNFLVFDRNGSSVYSDPSGSQVVHSIPVVAFLGRDLTVKSRAMGEYNLYKVSRGKIIIPYTLLDNPENRYLLVPTSETIDIMPVKTVFYDGVLSLVRDFDAGVRPDCVIVDNHVTENDLIVIKNRNSQVIIRNIVEESAIADVLPPDEGRRATDEFSDVNLNMLSQNPVFLARIHLRNLALSKVKQLLLDFDLSPIDASYIHTFISVMLNNRSEEIDRSTSVLEDLEKDFRFYSNVIERKKEEVYSQISEADSLSILTSYVTLLAKARSIYDDKGDDLDMIEIENALLDRQENIKK